ncbi:MAG: LacI family DNA-binding transcriptional regulator [Bryobacteraceae bacterium]
MPTIGEVAKRAGVGIATVSRTLHDNPRVSPETAARVRRVMEELGYRPNTNAQSLVSGRSRMFGLVVSDITNPFFPELVKGFQDLASQNGYDVLVASTNYDTARMAMSVGRMIERKVDGVAIMTSEIDRALTDQLSSRNVPLVFLDVGKVSKGVSNVKVDYACGITEAVNHLLSLGHKHIAFVSGPAALTSARVRRTTFLSCLKQHGISERLVEEGNHKIDGGVRAIARLLRRRDPPTAVLASNDQTAIGVLSGIRQAGLHVPDDISVVGFDDIDMAGFTEPPLTTVRLARTELADLACKALLASMRGSRMGRELRMTTSLVIRESTARVSPKSVRHLTSAQHS